MYSRCFIFLFLAQQQTHVDNNRQRTAWFLMCLCSCQFSNNQKGILTIEMNGVLISNCHYTDSHSQRDHEY